MTPIILDAYLLLYSTLLLEAARKLANLHLTLLKGRWFGRLIRREDQWRSAKAGRSLKLWPSNGMLSVGPDRYRSAFGIILC